MCCPTPTVADRQRHTLQTAGQLHWGQTSGLEGTSSRGLGQMAARCGEQEGHVPHGAVSMPGCTGAQGGPNSRLPIISSDSTDSLDNKQQLGFLRTQDLNCRLSGWLCLPSSVRPHQKALYASPFILQLLLSNSQGAKLCLGVLNCIKEVGRGCQAAWD